MPHIDYYLSVISPWAYFAQDRLEAVAARHGATIRYRPLDLNQLFDRTGGVRRSDRHPSRLAYREQDLPRFAAHLGVPFKLNPRGDGTNAAPAAYAIIAAQDALSRGAQSDDLAGDLAGFVQSLMRAHWAEDRDIADDATLRDLLQAADFDPALVDSGLFIGAEAYGRNLEDAIREGVFGVPFYIVTDSGQRFWGQDRIDFLDRHLAAP